MESPLSPNARAARWLWLATASLATVCFIALSASPAQAQDNGSAPRLKTESPYFFVKSDTPGVDALPLKSTSVDVQISGVIADVTVTQRYKNEGQRAIEARYVFPASTRAAVYGMNVRLADRLITANIREKQQARIEYDAARNEGKTAALLEQHLPNVFEMNVANILPGDDVKVELRYTELLVPQSGAYQFVFPTVVGPRYNSAQSSQALAQWVAQPFLPAGQASATAFDIKVKLATPIGIKEVSSHSHSIDVTKDGDERAAVSLRSGDKPGNNRDFILDYRLAGERIESGVMLYQGTPGNGASGENFFLAMIEPPKQVAAQAISPRDYIFVVDISGSMHGFPLDTAKTLMRELIGKLRPSDTFNVLLFSGSNRFLSPASVPATQANIEQAVRTIDEMGGGGGTELIPALKRVYAEPKAADVSRTVVVVTDGFVTVEREAFELVRRNLSQANLFSFGIGSSVNRHLMEGLARAGMGEPFIITEPSQARAQAERFRRLIESPVLTSVKLRFEGLDVYDVEPAQLPDVLGERPVVVFGKWRGTPAGQVIIDGQSATGPYRNAVTVPAQNGQNTAALRYLWARHRIASLSDQEALEGGDAHRQRITELGLQYNLLTQYTSFLAVDQVVRNLQPQDATGVNQPSPLPQGVSNLAVGEVSIGAAVPGTPEPATWGAVLVLLSVLALLARRERRASRGRPGSAARFTA
ncbi:VIT and vWA domain-containing protein [Polaromonas naphthalenivorans]|uniref:Vault protein inter-alpha-trypsin domain protein n=1 Tax=Polaromonas naphthalenivorans (strain CJ2) TaxID=365044 RepID=A1VI76_POLNA|nr:VIT and VWA domain-containing protein [Polaromonas naphthalenivorans]ABM35354.1 Vault protein inter-alpha-trypsin domain protein [Polaromonas naphthalenivorans CJ2]